MAISFTGNSRFLVEIYNLIYRLVRVLYRKPTIRGYTNIRSGSPAVFIANHENSYGPIILATHLPSTFYPWVTHEIMDKQLCPAYVEKDFIYKELSLKPPLSVILSALIGRICVSLMDYLGAIPVYKGDRNAVNSLQLSVEYLEAGKNVLLFPEIAGMRRNEKICTFDNGFVRIAKLYTERNKENVLFYPVAVDKSRRRVTIGKAVTISLDTGFQSEKRRVAGILEQSICEMIER